MEKKTNHLIEVAVAAPVDGTFTYRVPAEFADCATPGVRVLVPFGNRKITGYIIGAAKENQAAEIKNIISTLDDIPAIPADLLKDLLWMAEYYLAPVGEVFKGALPAGFEVSGATGLVVSEAGEKALANLGANPLDRDILARVASEPGIPSKRLEKIVDAKNASARVSALVRKGWIIRQDKTAETSLKPREGKLLRVVETNPEKLNEIIAAMKKSAPARAKMFARIAFSEKVLASELSSHFSNSAQLVRKLEQDGLIVSSTVRIWRDPGVGETFETEPAPPTLTPHQSQALEKIYQALDNRSFAPFLLNGVTGSGKTEVYLRAIAKTIELGRQAVVLVPEIALTPQLVGRFRARFGRDVAVLHSALGRGERLDEWTRVRRGLVKVAIGARSAVFAPFDNIGLIVVDEEHDGGYKQDDKVRYNARDFAVMRARTNNAVAILGSATPSIESRHNAIEKKYALLNLPHRVKEQRMPAVKIVDLRTASMGRAPFLSETLEKAIEENLEAKKQTLLFLNRRGYAPFIMCVQCGHTFGCPYCSASATFHKQNRMMRCHLCDWAEPAPDLCPNCGGSNIKTFGVGTQRIEDELARIFPEARVARLDRDTAGRKGEIERILASLRDGDIDILTGTQMIAKGHDYPGVTLVGVILAETSLNFPDFRAAETTFSLLTQVAGRAGRGEVTGNVVVQTYNPDHYAIQRALTHDYEGFAAEESALRKKHGYPPYRKLAALRFSGKEPSVVRDAAETAVEFARKINGVETLGPSPAPWSKIKSEYRWQMLIKSEKSAAARKAASHALRGVQGKFKGVKISVDIDPLQML